MQQHSASSIQTIARREISKGHLLVSLVVLLVGLPIILISLINDSKHDLDTAFKASEHLLRNSVQLGDSFQNSKIVSSIAAAVSADKAQLLDTENNSIILFGPETVAFIESDFQYSLIPFRFESRKYLNSQDGQQLGQLLLTGPIKSTRILYFLGYVLAFLIFSEILFYILVRRFANKVVKPLEQLPTLIEEDQFSSSGIDEIDQVLARLKDAKGQSEKIAKMTIEIEKQKSETLIARQVAHDIRSPLSALKVALQVSGLIGDSKDLFAAATSRIEGITNDLLNRNQNSVTIPPSEVQPIRDLILQIVAEHKLKDKKAEIEFLTDLSFPGDRRITADGTELQRALSNILDNAARATGPKGIVRINAKLENDHLKLEITDNGVGIPGNIMNKIGTCGFTTFGRRSGNGLGIHYAKSVAERSGGRFSIKSAFGSGTQVTMEIPASC